MRCPNRYRPAGQNGQGDFSRKGSGDPALQLFIFTNPTVVAVEAEGRLADSRLPRRVKGVVRLGGAHGYELLRWLDRDFALPQS